MEMVSNYCHNILQSSRKERKKKKIQSIVNQLTRVNFFLFISSFRHHVSVQGIHERKYSLQICYFYAIIIQRFYRELVIQVNE